MQELKTRLFTGSKGAIISPCGNYRYALWRIWSPGLKLLMSIGLNPSTADAYKDDPTIRRDVGYAIAWGFGGLLKANLYGFRSTYPNSLSTVADPVGPDNDLWLVRMRDEAGMHLAAWGAHGDFDLNRTAKVIEMFPELYCLGLTQHGHPRHPLRLAKTLQPERWNVQNESLRTNHPTSI